MKAKRVCSVPNCPTLTDGGRCPTHRRMAEQQRGTPTQRGYGASFQAERRQWKAMLDTEPWPCARCGRPIQPGEPFHLDHSDDRSGLLGPSCPKCNTSAGGKAAHR
jgi:hypothetical protein